VTAVHDQETTPGTRGAAEEIAARVREIRASGGGVLPPLLLLGTMERVGSNWVSDTLRPVTGQHNEPFRQQLGPAHPLSALNPGLSPDEPLDRLGPYGRHWLVTFAAGKHAAERQVIKETNLFFALPALLGLFPGSPVAVLTRSPLGVASSFARGDLFRRWDYRARYRQVTAMATRPEYAAFAGVVPDDDPADLTALARLQVLNTLLIASALHQRGDAGKAEVIRYETSVLDPGAAHAALARLVPEAPRLTSPHSGPPAGAAADDTFATTAGKDDLTALLSAVDAEDVSAAAARALSAGREAVPGPAWDLARDWAGGGELYSLAPPRPRALPGRSASASRLSCPVRWVAGHSGGLRWRNLLVTNDEFAAFLNEMGGAGLPNHMDGCYLLAVEMPRERGGRLHYNRYARRWAASPGFGHHPAYWVTWAGAAAYAARHGARLPARAELLAETSRDTLTVTNCAYQAGDTVPAAEPGRSPGEIHHVAGNLQVWCADGPDDGIPEGPASRWLVLGVAATGDGAQRRRAVEAAVDLRAAVAAPLPLHG
jgi:hypothetical protein